MIGCWLNAKFDALDTLPEYLDTILDTSDTVPETCYQTVNAKWSLVPPSVILIQACTLGEHAILTSINQLILNMDQAGDNNISKVFFYSPNSIQVYKIF